MSAPKDIDFINLNDISSGPELIPEAEYHLKIVDGELKENKAKDGYYINYRTVVQSGEYAGRSIFSMWSLKDTAAWRMKKDFKAMGYAPPGGVPHLADLFGFEGVAKVKIVKSEGYDDKNSVDRWIAPLS